MASAGVGPALPKEEDDVSFRSMKMVRFVIDCCGVIFAVVLSALVIHGAQTYMIENVPREFHLYTTEPYKLYKTSSDFFKVTIPEKKVCQDELESYADSLCWSRAKMKTELKTVSKCDYETDETRLPTACRCLINEVDAVYTKFVNGTEHTAPTATEAVEMENRAKACLFRGQTPTTVKTYGYSNIWLHFAFWNIAAAVFTSLINSSPNMQDPYSWIAAFFTVGLIVVPFVYAYVAPKPTFHTSAFFDILCITLPQLAIFVVMLGVGFVKNVTKLDSKIKRIFFNEWYLIHAMFSFTVIVCLLNRWLHEEQIAYVLTSTLSILVINMIYKLNFVTYAIGGKKADMWVRVYALIFQIMFLWNLGTSALPVGPVQPFYAMPLFYFWILGLTAVTVGVDILDVLLTNTGAYNFNTSRKPSLSMFYHFPRIFELGLRIITCIMFLMLVTNKQDITKPV